MAKESAERATGGTERGAAWGVGRGACSVGYVASSLWHGSPSRYRGQAGVCLWVCVSGGRGGEQALRDLLGPPHYDLKITSSPLGRYNPRYFEICWGCGDDVYTLARVSSAAGAWTVRTHRTGVTMCTLAASVSSVSAECRKQKRELSAESLLMLLVWHPIMWPQLRRAPISV